MTRPTLPLADLRKSYERAELHETASHADPLQQFGQWLDQAISAQVPEPNAMTLATVDSQLRPSTRIVLIKGVDPRGIVWFSNYDSRKGQELAANPHAALQFHWVELERVVRIEGVVEKVSDAESDTYFNSRPLDSRIGAWASPQSQVISGRGVLVANAARYGLIFHNPGTANIYVYPSSMTTVPTTALVGGTFIVYPGGTLSFPSPLFANVNGAWSAFSGTGSSQAFTVVEFL